MLLVYSGTECYAFTRVSIGAWICCITALNSSASGQSCSGFIRHPVLTCGPSFDRSRLYAFREVIRLLSDTRCDAAVEDSERPQGQATSTSVIVRAT